MSKIVPVSLRLERRHLDLLMRHPMAAAWNTSQIIRAVIESWAEGRGCPQPEPPEEAPAEPR